MNSRNKKATIAMVQLVLLVLSVIAIGFILGSGVKVVSATNAEQTYSENDISKLIGRAINSVNLPPGLYVGILRHPQWKYVSILSKKMIDELDPNHNFNMKFTKAEVDAAISKVIPQSIRSKVQTNFDNLIENLDAIEGSSNTNNNNNNKNEGKKGGEQSQSPQLTKTPSSSNIATKVEGGLNTINTAKALGNSIFGSTDKTEKPSNDVEKYTAELKKAKSEAVKISQNSKSTEKEIKAAAAKVAAAAKKLSAAEASSKTSKELLKKPLFKKLFTGGNNGMSAIGTILRTYAVAFASAIVYVQIAKMLGAGARNMQGIKVASYTAAFGVGTGALIISSITGGLSGSGAFALGFVALAPWVAAGVIAAALIYTALSYKDYSQEKFSYSAGIWQPQDGGKYCGQCNKLEYGCSEYQCHSFGRACDIINKGTNHPECIWINKNDMLPPTLKPLKSALPSENYHYIKADSVLPGETGVRITYKNNNCVPAFTPISFGVRTNEVAECKIDINRKANMSQMSSYMAEGSVSIYNHTLTIPAAGLPSSDALKAAGYSAENGKNYQFFIRCKDVNGNPTPSDFLMEFCVQNGPDTMAPVITGTNYLPDSYISYNHSKVPLEVYTNEPADCRWDFRDTSYNQMGYNMTNCSGKVGSYLIPQTYTYGCQGELTGIKDGQKNKYYIRCKDKPWLDNKAWLSSHGYTKDNPPKGKRFANQQSYVLDLIGTEPLQINNIKINDLKNGASIIDSVAPTKIKISVDTSAGADEGNAKCQYKIGDKFYDFYNGGNLDYNHVNTQKLYLTAGNYNYTIKCVDKAGNTAEDFAFFNVTIDTTPPVVTRIYYENDKLKLKTNEKATCVYSLNSCNYPFKDGVALTTTNNFDHYTSWNTNFNLYIKCKDSFGNRPIPQDKCSIIARAFQESK